MRIKDLEGIIKTGDFFVCCAKPKQGIFGYLTRLFGMSEFVHAGVFFWQGRHLMCAEARIKGDYCKESGFHIEPVEIRMKSLAKQYSSTHLIRPDKKVTNNPDAVRSIVNKLKGRGYSYIKGFPIVFGWNIRSHRIMCSTVCELVNRACGVETLENWHPSDVWYSGVNLGKII